MRSILAVLAVLPCLIAAPARATAAMPAWLAGNWTRQDGAAWAETTWTAPRDGLMLGMAWTGFGSHVESWESARIERAAGGEPVLVVQVRGGGAIRYNLAVASEAAIEFANAAQESTQRIRYSREGQLLVIETSRLDGSAAQRWNYRPLAAAPAD